MKKLFVVLFLLTIFGCTTSNTEHFVSPSREIYGKIIIDQDSSLLIGRRGTISSVINGSIYIFDPWGTYFFSKYDINNDIAYRFCQIGQGPGEVMNTVIGTTLFVKNSTNYISVFDNYFRKFIFFSEMRLDDNNSVLEMSLKASQIITEAFQINDSIVIAIGVFEKNICAFFKNGEIQNS
jgi:hypothetical protein